MLDSWDDLRVMLAAAQEGTVTAAGRRLGVDPTTVTRRLRALEERLGTRLFQRISGGIELTARGRLYVAAAQDIEDRVFALDRSTQEHDELQGPLRLAIPELLAYHWMPALVAFVKANPALELQIATGYHMHDLDRREADVAVRYVVEPPEHLVGRRLSRVALAVYAGATLDDVDLEEVPWIGWDPREGVPDTAPDLRVGGEPQLYVSDYLSLLAAVRHGAGSTVLPCIVGDVEPGLTRRTPPALQRQWLWVLTHPDLRRSPKVRVLMSELSGLVDAQRAALEGRATRLE